MTLLGIYQRLLHLYPQSYQNEYSDEMLSTLKDMLSDCPDKKQKANIWTQAFVEVPFRAAQLSLRIIEEVYMSTTPNYMRRNTQLSGMLLTPFILLLMLNELRPSALPTAHDWIGVYQTVAFVLPLLALLISVVTVGYWLRARRKNQATSLSVGISDIRHTWSIVVVGGFALLIVAFMAGHDSVHCVTGNPVKEIHNPTDTLQCISRD